MNVVVRMEMPQHCGECNLYVDGWCYALTPDSPQEKEWYASHKERPPMCPILCQLPEGHGRLGDLDALADDVRSLWDYKTVDGITATTVLNQTLTDIRNCPTIVPAERSET